MVKILAKTFILLLAANSVALASFEDLGVGARPISMGQAFVGLAEGPEAIFFNPAGLGAIMGTRVALFYCRPYGLDEIAYGTVSIIHSVNSVAFGVAFQNFGNKLYQENILIGSLGGSYKKRLYYGFNLRYMRLAIQGYGSEAAFGLDFGLLIPLSTKVKWGLFSHNSNRPAIGEKRERLPQVFSTGLSINPVRNLFITFDLYKDLRFPLEIRWGSEFKLLDHLVLRSGVGRNPSRFSVGFGIPLPFGDLDYAFYTHPHLGLTHQVSLCITLRKRSQ